MKATYVIQHYSKEVRTGVEKTRREGNKDSGKDVRVHGRYRKKQRVWTLNRSPHGNKTAREQFGRQIWQRKRENLDQEQRKAVRRSEHGKVSRKEKRVVRS